LRPTGVVLLALLLLGAAPAPEQSPAPGGDVPFTPDSVIQSLERALGWYRQARIVMRSVNGLGGTFFGRDDEEAARHLLERAFDAARAQAALLDRKAETRDAAGVAQPSNERERLEAAVGREEQDLARLRQRVRAAPPANRRALERQALALKNQLELDRARLDFVVKLGTVDSSLSDHDGDLAHQIQALHDSVPELASGASTSPTSATAVEAPSGSAGPVRRLLALQRGRRSLDDLEAATSDLARSNDRDLQTVKRSLDPVVARLGALARDPATGTTLAEGEREFHDLLERGKQLAAVTIPLREEAALVRRFADDLQGWQRAVDRQSLQLLQGIALDFVGVVVALAAILVGGLLWRVAVVRYVHDVYRRRLLLTVRNVVTMAAIALVLIFHFTTELTALVTALGFAAAGIALALQNVILAVAGYFSMVAPNGIRVGDRVSLQGPFGYVHGEVIDIGFVRIRLQELAGNPLTPTGRIVVFPNSVVFTGSFFKDLSTREEPPARAAA
jgi:hypothetical protein